MSSLKHVMYCMLCHVSFRLRRDSESRCGVILEMIGIGRLVWYQDDMILI